MNLYIYGLKDLHSDTIYCHGSSVKKLGEEFDLNKYRVSELEYKEFPDYGHELIKETIVHNPIQK